MLGRASGMAWQTCRNPTNCFHLSISGDPCTMSLAIDFDRFAAAAMSAARAWASATFSSAAAFASSAESSAASASSSATAAAAAPMAAAAPLRPAAGAGGATERAAVISTADAPGKCGTAIWRKCSWSPAARATLLPLRQPQTQRTKNRRTTKTIERAKQKTRPPAITTLIDGRWPWHGAQRDDAVCERPQPARHDVQKGPV
mmetsp:Transcript_4229/g.15584  ORF Transcript_4229/g.15584 Transcript_4229/m.15584 type:complete len:202 (-) Transcript_4229:5975-6580(-)